MSKVGLQLLLFLLPVGTPITGVFTSDIIFALLLLTNHWSLLELRSFWSGVEHRLTETARLCQRCVPGAGSWGSPRTLR